MAWRVRGVERSRNIPILHVAEQKEGLVRV